MLDSMVQMAKDYSSQLKKLLAEGMSQEGDPARSNDVSPCTMLLRLVLACEVVVIVDWLVG